MISVKNINRTINSIKYKRDKVDEWKTPEDFKKNGGDCEDFAIAKYFELEKQGHDITETEFAYCELNGQAHMVLLHEGTVLDNTTNDIKPLDERKDIKVIYKFNKDYISLNGKKHKNNIAKWNDLMSRMNLA